MLQDDRSLVGNSRQFRLFQNELIVQQHSDFITDQDDDKSVPLSDRVIRVDPRCHARPDLWRRVLVIPQAIDFAGTDRPAPEIQLRL